MQFSISLEHAFHSLFYMVELPKNKTISIKKIAEIHGLSDTYLSKIFSKLRKAGIVRSVPGNNGGYELAKAPEDISFWNIIEAIEGSSYLFQCAEIRDKSILKSESNSCNKKRSCLIKIVMYEAEELFRNSLKNKSLGWLYDVVSKEFPKETKTTIRDWMEKV